MRVHDITRQRRTVGRLMDRPEIAAALETTWQPPEWMELGECGRPIYRSEMWFQPSKSAETRDAAAICFGCPVRSLCREYALEHRIQDGTWGGLSEREIRGLIRARDIAEAEAERKRKALAKRETS